MGYDSPRFFWEPFGARGGETRVGRKGCSRSDPNLRELDGTHDRTRPWGPTFWLGGEGCVLKPEPLFAFCVATAPNDTAFAGFL